VLLFHLHFEAPDVQGLEAKYVSANFSVKARFGYVGREHRRFHLESAMIACADPESARALLVDLLGASGAAQISFVSGPRSHAELCSCTLTGTSEAAKARLALH
jgi:hypothetical protein